MTRLFSVWLPLPPPKNALRRVGRFGAWATREYRDWLAICAPKLDAAIEYHLGADYVPDTEHWWDIRVCLCLPPRAGDSQNYEEAILDLLTGRRVDGKESKILRPDDRGLWDDDNRVAMKSLQVLSIYDARPGVRIDAKHAPAPSDDRVRQEAEERQRKAAAKEAAAAARFPRACGTCGAAVGQPCRTASGNARKEHDGR